MRFPCSCHAPKQHCKWANFQERLLEKVQHNREENEGSHPCDCQPTAEAGSSGSKSLTRRSISALNAYASSSRLASSVERLLAVTLRVTLCHSKRQAQSNRLSARLSWLQTHSHVCVSLARCLSTDNQAARWASDVLTVRTAQVQRVKTLETCQCCRFTVDFLCDSWENVHLSNRRFSWRRPHDLASRTFSWSPKAVGNVWPTAGLLAALSVSLLTLLPATTCESSQLTQVLVQLVVLQVGPPPPLTQK